MALKDWIEKQKENARERKIKRLEIELAHLLLEEREQAQTEMDKTRIARDTAIKSLLADVMERKGWKLDSKELEWSESELEQTADSKTEPEMEPKQQEEELELKAEQEQNRKNKKYSLTGETKVVDGITLLRDGKTLWRRRRLRQNRRMRKTPGRWMRRSDRKKHERRNYVNIKKNRNI